MALPVSPKAVNRALLVAKGLANRISPGAGDVSMPYAGKPVPLQRAAGGAAAEPDIFDMSQLHETPKVPQFDLPRYTPARGVSSRVADLTSNKKVYGKMMDTVGDGLKMGGGKWYNTEPLRHAFVNTLGQEHGNAAHQKYMDLVAATSPRSDVGTNIRNASYYYHRLATGKGAPEIGEKNPQPYGHMAQRLHQQNVKAVAGDGWDPLQNPKPASFVQNLVGNQHPATVDTHAFRLPAILSEDPRFLISNYASSKEAPKENIRKMVEGGHLSMGAAKAVAAYWDAMPKENEYGAMERYYKKIAKGHGITPAQAQAAAWVGGHKVTGLKSDESKPFMKVFQDRIFKNAKETGKDPKDVLTQFIKGVTPLRASGGRV